MAVFGSAPNGEMSDMAWTSPEKRTGSSVELHLENIWHEFQRMQQRIDSLGRERSELEQLVSGSHDQEMWNEVDLREMVSSTVMDLERTKQSAVPEDVRVYLEDAEKSSKVPDEVCAGDPGVEEKLREVKHNDSRHHPGSPKGHINFKEHSSCSHERKSHCKPHGGRMSQRNVSALPQGRLLGRRASLSSKSPLLNEGSFGAGRGLASRRSSALRTMSRYKAAQESNPPFEPSSEVLNGTESVLGEHRSIADESRRQEKLKQFKKMQENCGGTVTVESVQSFAAELEEEWLDEDLLIDSFKCIVEKSRAGLDDDNNRSDSDVDFRTLDFPAFLLLLDFKELEERIVDESPEVQQCIYTLQQVLGSEANKILHQELRETMIDKIKPRNVRGLVTTAFDIISVFVILLNTLAVGIQTEDTGNEVFWEVAEILFFSFYLVELVVKARICGVSVFLFKGHEKFWNRLDLLLLLMSGVDLIVSYGLQASDDGNSFSVLKVLRLVRLARLVRVMRFKMFRELKVMVLGLISGLRALIWAIVLLLLLIYVGGIIAVSVSDVSDLEYNTMEKAMFTLFRCFTDGCAAYDGTPLTEHLRKKHGWLFFVGWILTTMLVTVGIFNLIMAVFIDNVTKSQQQRKQKELGETAGCIDTNLKLLITKFLTNPGGKKETLRMATGGSLSSLGYFTELAKARDMATRQKLAQTYFQVLIDDEVTISRDVFMMWLEDTEFTDVLEEAEVDLSAKADLFDILDVDMGGELSADELVTGLMKLRGDVSKGDIVAILLQVRHLTQQVEDLLETLDPVGKGTQDLLI